MAYNPVCALAFFPQIYIMQFLFKVTTVYNESPVVYNVHKVNPLEYYILPALNGSKGFTLKRCDRIWIAIGWCTEMQAVEIGDLIDARLNSAA
jgi:hypothetical protein